MPWFLPRLENTEASVTKALSCFRVLFFTHHEDDGISRSIGFHNTSVFSNNITDGNDVWKINDMLIYKDIIHFSCFTAHHENYGISRSIGFRNTSVFPIIVTDWNEVWKINNMLLYQGIIDFPRSTVNYENGRISRSIGFRTCSVFSEHGLVKVNNTFI